jgi:hypothetical protein
MLPYNELTKYFGISLQDLEFQAILESAFPDLSEYTVFSDYMVSQEMGIELGFVNNSAVFDDDEAMTFEDGNPVFSHFNASPISAKLLGNLPFGILFSDRRSDVIEKAGAPYRTYEGFLETLNKPFLTDAYKLDNFILSLDYDPELKTINFIQIRDSSISS